jgi:hypothetical protein
MRLAIAGRHCDDTEVHSPRPPQWVRASKKGIALGLTGFLSPLVRSHSVRVGALATLS